jgi:hypothetical protein
MAAVAMRQAIGQQGADAAWLKLRVEVLEPDDCRLPMQSDFVHRVRERSACQPNWLRQLQLSVCGAGSGKC